MRSNRIIVFLIFLVAALGSLPAISQQDGQASAPATTPPSSAAEQDRGLSLPEPLADEPASSTTAPVPAPADADAETETATAEPGDVNSPVEALERGAAGAAQQGSNMWNQVLLPMWQRIASAFPSLIKALAFLIIFWVAALILGAAVRKLLNLTEIDDRAIKDWGLSGLLETKEGPPRSPATIAGRVTFWFIMMFGLVAFFQALQLNMVAEPLQNVVNSVVGVVPNLLEAFVILVAYWIIATLIRFALSKSLTAVRFDERIARHWGSREVDGETIGPSALLSRLAFYLILLFGLPPFLEALGQTALVTPLTAMLGEAFSFLPNVVAAVVIFFVGKLVATIVREVVTHFLAAAGADRSADRLGASAALGSRKLSDITGAIAYFFILITVFMAAIDSLGIAALSGPVSATLERLLTAAPLLLVALVVVAIGWVIAKAVRELVASFLEGIGFDQYPERFGVRFLAPAEGRASLSSIVATVVMAIILLLTAEQALATVGLTELGAMIGVLIAYLPQLLAGIAILVVAIALGSLVGRLTQDALSDRSHGRIAGLVARYGVIFLGASMALDQLGVGDEVVIVVVAAVLFGTALALGLAFGLGGRDKAKELVERMDSGVVDLEPGE